MPQSWFKINHCLFSLEPHLSPLQLAEPVEADNKDHDYEKKPYQKSTTHHLSLKRGCK